MEKEIGPKQDENRRRIHTRENRNWTQISIIQLKTCRTRLALKTCRTRLALFSCKDENIKDSYKHYSIDLY